MSRSERKRRYRARRRGLRFGRSPLIFLQMDHKTQEEIRATLNRMELRTLSACGIPADLLNGRVAVGIDFAFPGYWQLHVLPEAKT